LVGKPLAIPALLHWCEQEGQHDVRHCNWCQEQWRATGGAYPHARVPWWRGGASNSTCPCPWCEWLRHSAMT
jgi:hypothetical protein